MSNKDLAININELSVSFGKVNAINNISIKIERGTVFGYLGGNGSGKTTTIHTLLGLLKPTSGNASVLGYNIVTEGDKIRRESGALLEHNGLYESLSAEDNLEFYGRIVGLERNDRKERIYELLKNIELWDRRKEKVGNWSKGMKQKLAIARSIMHRPNLVFLDEPTSGLDPVSTSAFRKDLIKIVKDEGTTVFLTTHNLEEAEKLCDNIGILKQGELVAIGSQKDLREQNGQNRFEIIINNATPETIIKLNSISCLNNFKYDNEGLLIINIPLSETISPIVSKLVDSGFEIDSVKKTQESLEHLYLKLMEL